MEWRRYFKENTVNGGQDYVKSNSIRNLTDNGMIISADVDGLEKYHVEISYIDSHISGMRCNCPYGMASRTCKHMAAVLLAWDNISKEKKPDSEHESIKKENVDNNIPKKELQLTVKSVEVISYAIQQNGINIIDDVCLKNTTDKDITDLLFIIESDSQLIDILEIGIDKISAGEELHLKDIKININGNYLATLTERITCNIKFAIIHNNRVMAKTSKEITVFAFDQWPGLKYTPELLAAYSMPNHPVVSSLCQLAAGYLGKWTGDPSLAGYQFDDPNRVRLMAAAVYAAIQQKNITYANPPSSFEEFGQRIRLADTVIEQHLGTCLDMTLLYVACLEAIGLNTIMIMMKGHIFAGVWLIDDSFSETIMEDPSNIMKRMASGIHEILVVECTAMNAGKTRDFEAAVKAGEKHVSDYRDFLFAIDVARARSMGIRPLPIRVKTDAGFVVKHEERNSNEITNAPTKEITTFDLSNLPEKEKTTKIIQWERKLLDLSLRNQLINLRFTKTIVPILCNNIGLLEYSLTEGEEFLVLPRPDNMGINGDGIAPEMLTDLGDFQDYIELENKHKKLHSIYTDKELTSSLTKIYRSARTSMEENGASTLYLALGLLRWLEDGKENSVHYAPVILVPIDIIRKTAGKGYSLRMRDEDAQINITLLEFFKQNYDVHITGLSPLPTDDHGLDIPKIFAIIRHEIINLEMWDVLEASVIGNFSFSQFVMWNDIHNRSDFLIKNNIVRSLIKGAVDWDCTIPGDIDNDEAYLPITVDASQLRAINMAANGVSFVLHGPPGTGKSQTITAMIANALTKGKTVLFVAEKMAALEVVKKRLDILGIGDFYLELHSNKATKKSVLDQLKKTLEIGEWGRETDYNEQIKEINEMREELDSYAKKLHMKRGFGKSVKELIDIYETFPDYGKEFQFSTSYVSALSQNDLNNQKKMLEQLVAAGRGIGHPSNHPLGVVEQTEYTQTLKLELKSVITGYKNALEELKVAVEPFIQITELDLPVTKQGWDSIRRSAEGIIAAESIPEMFIYVSNLDKEFDFPLSYVNEKEKFEARRNVILRNWKESFIGMNMSLYRTKYDEANKKFFGKNRALATLVSEIQMFANFTVNAQYIPTMLADIELYQRQEKEFNNMNNMLSFEWKQIIAKYQSPKELLEYKSYVQKKISDVKEYESIIKELSAAKRLEESISYARKYIEANNDMLTKENEVVSLIKISFDDSGDNFIKNRIDICDRILSNYDSIRDWISYKNLENRCREQGLGVVCDAYNNGLPHEQLVDIYLKSMYKSIILYIIELEPIFNSFTGNGFNEKILQFKKLDNEFMELTKEEMYYKLSHNLPNSFESVELSKELNILRRAITSNGRGLSIRSLFDQIPNILSRLTPCILMSPISVAQYLSADNKAFDIVIFDEASQIPTCKAVGALARGKSAVIVGDPNQMPPTSFFAGNTIDEDNLDIEDLDSILDDCLALGMPSAHLQWHYRSRRESLIAFSNHEFYENSMLTFPSVKDRERSVKLEKVDGIYNRNKGRINEAEGKAIVEEIKRRYKEPELKKDSIGVVTFNISQQTYIEDLLQEEYQKDINFDKWASGTEEPLFVKNLENVQGDERDVILFSIAFGPDEEGKLSHNFGPINNEGGWKRLNVAVSRARREMVVFSIMTADMINLKRTKAKGVEALKDFLDYAERGELQLSATELPVKKNQGIINRICKELTDAGYTYQEGVGHSKFKVDIAIINPYNEDEYLLGIMLDGESYRQASNTKDREVAQINVLQELGWKLHRIWSMDWWDNKQKEIDKLLQLLDEQKKIAYKRAEENEISDKHEDTEKHINDLISSGDVIDDKDNAVNLSAESLANPLVEDITESVKKNTSLETVAREKTENVLSDHDIIVENNEFKNSFRYENTTGVTELPLTAGFDNGVIKSLDSILENKKNNSLDYSCETYISADIEPVILSSSDYALKSSLPIIINHAQEIINIESPISHERLLKKTLKSFGISRTNALTIEVTEKAIKKTESKSNKQNGIKFYWRTDQNPDTYNIYRIDADNNDKRSLDDVTQQELKNALCKTIHDFGAMNKEELFKKTVKTMGYSRSNAKLIEAMERGLKYARKSGEIIQDEDKRFVLNI